MRFLKGLTRWFHIPRIGGESQPVRGLGESVATRSNSEGITELAPNARVGACGHTIVDGRHYPRDGGIAVECIQATGISRRSFLFGLGATIAVTAAPKIPFARVWSFPTGRIGLHADPHRIDCLNTSHWLALQLEEVRHKLPVLYEHDEIFNISMRPFRAPFYWGVDGGELPRGSQAWDVETVGDERIVTRSWEPIPGSDMMTQHELRSRRNLEFWRGDQFVSGDQLLDSAGNALTARVEKAVDKAIIEPARVQLQEICDLVNS